MSIFAWSYINRPQLYYMKKITGKTYLDWYENMLLWRKFEDKLAAKYIETYDNITIKFSSSNDCRWSKLLQQSI